MKSLFNYIIRTDNRYNNKIDVDGKELVVNTEITERDAIFVNRIGTIVATPISLGDRALPIESEVIVHHNVFRRMVNMSGKEVNSTNHLEDNLYLVYEDQIFGYKENGEWEACKGYCFVRPRENEDTWINGDESILCGEIVFADQSLKGQGVERGDVVGFTPHSEYEFTIDGEKLYRILSNQININYGHKENATKETRSS